MSQNTHSLPNRAIFDSAFKYASIGMALVDLDGTWIEVNDALCRIVGYSKAELYHLSFQDITHPDDLEADRYNMESLLAGTIDSCELEKRYFHKDGRLIWILLSGSLVRDERQNPVFFIAQIQDITEKKIALAELQLVFENSPDIILRMDGEGRITFINQAVEKILGVSRLEYLGKTFAEVAEHARPSAQFIANVEQAVKTGDEITFDYQGILKPDTYYVCTVKPEFKGEARLNTFLLFFRDVTKKRRAELALEAKERELQSILKGTPTVISRMTHDFRHLFISEAIAAETGLPPEAFFGKTLAEVGIPPAVAETIETGVAEVFHTKKPVEVEFSHESPFGLKYQFGRFTPEFDLRGNVETVLTFSIDITQKKLAEIELRQALEEVKQLQKMLPICSYCRNVRDDQDYWHTVEDYIHKHTDVKFSHSICPDCYQNKILPELEKFKQRNQS